jgi:hypothetical protein
LDETGRKRDFHRSGIDRKVSMAARMVALVIGRFEVTRVYYDKLANLGTSQQMNGRTARATVSHDANHGVAKSV